MGVMLRMRSAFSENEPDLEKLIQDPNDDNHSHAASRVDITKVWNWLKNIPRKWKVFLGVFLMLCIILHNRYLGALSAYQQKIVLSSNPHRNLCTLESCLDFSRCEDPSKVFVYPRDAGLEGYLSMLEIEQYESLQNEFENKIVNSLRTMPSVTLTERPEEACLFVVRGMCFKGNKCDFWEGFAHERLTHLPYWNKTGRNHVIFDTDDNISTKFPTDDAILVQTAFHSSFIRPGYDVQMLLSGKVDMRQQAQSAAATTPFALRKTLLSFKGCNTYPLREKIVSLHNSDDVIILVKEFCSLSIYESTNYTELMIDSKFALVPRGFGTHVHRLMEALSGGSIPVIVSDGYELPLSDRLDWRSISFRFAESELDKIVPFLRSVKPETLLEMHKNILEIYPILLQATDLSLAIPVIQERIRTRRLPVPPLHIKDILPLSKRGLNQTLRSMS